jgi:hypothetical protein
MVNVSDFGIASPEMGGNKMKGLDKNILKQLNID